MSPRIDYPKQRISRTQTIVDPRAGDVESDASSTKRRSLLSLAGSFLTEISLPKLVVAWVLLVIVPALALGLAPLVASVWLGSLSDMLNSPLRGIWAILFLGVLLALGWFGGAPLYRVTETGFWALNSLVVEP